MKVKHCVGADRLFPLPRHTQIKDSLKEALKNVIIIRAGETSDRSDVSGANDKG